jgi:uncharacterized RDD family membrane protein YckC
MDQNQNQGYISIQSTELVFLESELANLGSRAMAYLIDTVIKVCAILAVFAFFSWTKLLAGKGMAVLIVLIAIITLGYHVFFEIILNGQTPGKKAAGLRVIKNDGTRLSVLDVFIRNVLRIVDFFPVYYVLAMVVIFFERHNRRIGDLIANTVVIYVRQGNQSIEKFIESRSVSAQPNQAIIIDGLEKLSATDHDIIKGLYSRIESLDEQDKKRILDKFEQAFAKKLTISGTTDPEVVLYEIYKRI